MKARGETEQLNEPKRKTERLEIGSDCVRLYGGLTLARKGEHLAKSNLLSFPFASSAVGR